MSKLPNAPLLEVIFEIRWKISNKGDLEKYQYLHGDLYSELKDFYPYRESLAPPEIPTDVLINHPMYRFRKAENDYPLYQVGPGIITLNTIDEKYYWDQFYEWSEGLISSFFKVYDFEEDDGLNPNLIYVDFFKLDFEVQNAYDFLNQNLNIRFEQNFFSPKKHPNNVNLGFYYRTDYGDLAVTFKKGKNNHQEDGIVMQTTIFGKRLHSEVNPILSWLDKTHDFSSNLFKDITKGELYKSFL